MTKEEYLRIKNDQKADNLPLLYFFAKLRGLKGVNSIQEFGAAFFLWIQTMMVHPADLSKLRRIYDYVYKELDIYFKIR